jgi:cytochrome c556
MRFEFQSADEDEYAGTMKRISTAFARLRRANAAMKHEDGRRAAASLETDFRWVSRYWERTGNVEATKLARQATAAARTTNRASTTMDMAALGRAEQSLERSCRECHARFRERLADGTYRIKRR